MLVNNNRRIVVPCSSSEIRNMDRFHHQYNAPKLNASPISNILKMQSFVENIHWRRRNTLRRNRGNTLVTRAMLSPGSPSGPYEFFNNRPNSQSSIKVYEEQQNNNGQNSNKRVITEITVQAPVQTVWKVLTDYEALPSFIPNLQRCERLPNPPPGKVLLLQQGCSQGSLWRLEAEAILEVEEIKGPLNRHEARFNMIAGDFKQCNGRWIAEPDPSSSVGMATILRYDISVKPKIPLPSAIMTYIVRAGLPANIKAIAERAELMANERLKASGLASWAGVEEDPPIPYPKMNDVIPDMEPSTDTFSDATATNTKNTKNTNTKNTGDGVAVPTPALQSKIHNGSGLKPTSSSSSSNDQLPTKGPFWAQGSPYAASAPLTAEQQRRRAANAAARSVYLGTAWVPLPPTESMTLMKPSAQEILNARLEDKERIQSMYPAFGLRGSRFTSNNNNGDENGNSSSGSTSSSSSSSSTSNSSSSSSGNNSGPENSYHYENGLPSPLSMDANNGDSMTSSMGNRSFSSINGSIDINDTPSSSSSSSPLQSQSPSSLSGSSNQALHKSAEVHLRRLDTLETLHRRAVTAITIDAPASLVWDVLTDYNRLAEFIPNLAASERIKLPPSAPQNVVRVRQVGYKRMMYMCLHAESILDLIEKPYSEIQFRQVAGDFEHFQGKWMLSEIPSPDPDLVSTPGYNGPQTQIKYAVEIIIPRAGTGVLGIIEPVLEKVVFEDCPANLAAIKHRVESLQMERAAMMLEKQGQGARAAALRKRYRRPRLNDMVDDITVLAAELERCFGEEKAIPRRNALRDMNRTDLEKAIAAHGGSYVVSQKLGWKEKKGLRTRKPRGYWDSLPNVQQEIDEFIEECGLEACVVPVKNDFIRAGRFDLAHAVERWGGLYELADALGYAVASPMYSARVTGWQEHISEVAAETGLSGKQGLFELAAKTYNKVRDAEKSEKEVDEEGEEAVDVDVDGKRKKDYSTMREEIDAW